VAPSRDDNFPFPVDRRFGHDHFDTCRISAWRVTRTSPRLLITRAGFGVTGEQIVFRFLVLALDLRDLNARIADAPGIDIEDADQRFPDFGCHPASLVRLIFHHVDGDQYQREHEDDLDEKIYERRERDVAIACKSVPPDHRRLFNLAQNEA